MDEGTYRRWILVITAVILAIVLVLFLAAEAHAAPLQGPEPGPGHPGAVAGYAGTAAVVVAVVGYAAVAMRRRGGER
jgi:hypothetical protein